MASVDSVTIKVNSSSRNLQVMSTKQANKKKSTASSYTEQARLRGVAPIGVSFGRKRDKVVYTYEKPKNKSVNQEVKQQEDENKSESEQNRINLKRKEVEQFFQ